MGHNGRVPDRDFRSLRSLLPDSLAQLGAEGGGAALRSLWHGVIGGTIAQNTRARSFSSGVLTIEVSSPAWRATLEGEEPVLRARLNAALRTPSIERLAFEVRRPASP